MKKYWNAIISRLTLRARRGPVSMGIVGVGGWGLHNAVAVMRARRFTVRQVCDVRREVAQSFAERYGTEWCVQYQDLLARTDISCVALTVPNPLHGTMVRAAADAGKHVFIEKPLSTDAEECRELGRWCQERGVVLMVGHQLRREPALRAMKRILESGQLGRVLFATGLRTIPRPAGNWRRDPEACPYGSMEQVGTHLIDALVYLFGPAGTGRGTSRNIPFVNEGPEWGFLRLCFADSIWGTVITSYSAPNRLYLEVTGEKGVLIFDGRRLRLIAQGKSVALPARGLEGSVAQFIEFADCIEGQGRVETDAENSAAVAEAMSLMRRVDAGEDDRSG